MERVPSNAPSRHSCELDDLSLVYVEDVCTFVGKIVPFGSTSFDVVGVPKPKTHGLRV